MGEQHLRILGISAHPHDWTWYSGTFGIHIRRGDEATVCIVTHGGSTHREKWLDELRKPEAERDPLIVNERVEENSKRKEEEVRRSAALFGVTDIRMLGFPDRPFLLERYPEAIDRITDLILEVRPHVIISENPYRSGDTGRPVRHRNDHTEVGIAAMEAKERAGNPRPGSLVPPHRVPCTFWPGFNQSDIDFLVELSEEWFEKRVRSELFFETQGHDEAWARRRMAVQVGHLGWLFRVKYGEAFVREKPELLDGLPVPETMIRHAAEGGEERIRRLSD